MGLVKPRVNKYTPIVGNTFVVKDYGATGFIKGTTLTLRKTVSISKNIKTRLSFNLYSMYYGKACNFEIRKNGVVIQSGLSVANITYNIDLDLITGDSLSFYMGSASSSDSDCQFDNLKFLCDLNPAPPTIIPNIYFK